MTPEIKQQNVVAAFHKKDCARQHHLPGVVDAMGDDDCCPRHTGSRKPPGFQMYAID